MFNYDLNGITTGFTSFVSNAAERYLYGNTINERQDEPLGVWVHNNWQKEPIISSFIYNATTHDKNVPPIIRGGVRSVRQFSHAFQNPHVVADIKGWPEFMESGRRDYMTKAIGTIIKIERDPLTNRFLGMTSVGSSYCDMAVDNDDGNVKLYDNSENRFLRADEYIRVVARPSSDRMSGYGVPDIYIACQVLEVMIKYWMSLSHTMSTNEMNGILLLGNVDRNNNDTNSDTVDDLVKSREEQLEHVNNYESSNNKATPASFMKKLAVLASNDNITGQYIPVSVVPDHIGSMGDMVDAMARIMGAITQTDPNSVIPLKSGSFGDSKKSDNIHRAAEGTGRTVYLNALAQQINHKIMPVNQYGQRTTEFLFDHHTDYKSERKSEIESGILDNALKLKSLGGDWSKFLIEKGYGQYVEDSDEIESGAEKRNRHERMSIKSNYEMLLVARKNSHLCDPNEPIVEWNGRTNKMKMIGTADDITRRIYY